MLTCDYLWRSSSDIYRLLACQEKIRHLDLRAGSSRTVHCSKCTMPCCRSALLFLFFVFFLRRDRCLERSPPFQQFENYSFTTMKAMQHWSVSLRAYVSAFLLVNKDALIKISRIHLTAQRTPLWKVARRQVKKLVMPNLKKQWC